MSASSPAPNMQQRPLFEPQCTHLTMARVYDPMLLCLACHRPGPSGWVYRCTQDREDMIEHSICRGEMMCFDSLGQHLSGQLRMRKGSPAARENRFSFFDEITPHQMSTHKPGQVAIILRQRENVQAAIQIQRLRSNSAEMIHRRNFSLVSNPISFKKPWVTDTQDECQYRICPRCRPGAADRAYLSLNAIADGEIPPTAAVGYGFHVLGERPVVNADIVVNMGRRPGSALPSNNSPSSCQIAIEIGRPTFRSSQSTRQFFETPLPTSSVAQAEFENDNDGKSLQPSLRASMGPALLKDSPGCDNLQVHADHTGEELESIEHLLRTLPPDLDDEEEADTDNC